MKRFLLLLVTLLFSAFALAAVNINTATKGDAAMKDEKAKK
jgi:hypothetical protein